MAHKVLSKDMAMLVQAMKQAQKYARTTLDMEYRKGMLASAHALAMDAKNLLDTVDSVRVRLETLKSSPSAMTVSESSTSSSLIDSGAPESAFSTEESIIVSAVVDSTCAALLSQNTTNDPRSPLLGAAEGRQRVTWSDLSSDDGLSSPKRVKTPSNSPTAGPMEFEDSAFEGGEFETR